MREGLSVNEAWSNPTKETPKDAVLQFGAGYRTYIIAPVLVLVVEKSLGFDVPRVDVG